MKKEQPEFKLQRTICTWLSIAHKDILFLSDTVASVKLTLPQQARNKSIQKKDFKTPDLLIFEPNEKYHGLFLELKSKTPFKKNGQLLSNEHLEGQKLTIDQLNEKGYFACFAWDILQIMGIVNDYLNNKL